MFECKNNFQNQYQEDLACRICKDVDSIEDENHLLLCKVLNDELYDVEFNDVFKDVNKQYEAVQVFKKVMRRRKVYMEILNQSFR